jgi:hypothetical protein
VIVKAVVAVEITVADKQDALGRIDWRLFDLRTLRRLNEHGAGQQDGR